MCNAFRSTSGCARDLSKTLGGPSLNCRFQRVIWFGCTSKQCAKSARVLFPAIAANATLALNPAEWLRLVLSVMSLRLVIDRSSAIILADSSLKTFAQIPGATSQVVIPPLYLRLRSRRSAYLERSSRIFRFPAQWRRTRVRH